MSKQVRGLVVGLVIGFIAISAAGMMFTKNLALEGTYGYLKLFNEVLSLVSRSYVDEVKTDSLLKGAYEGLLSELDPFSEYLTAEEYRRYASTGAGQGAAAVGTGLRVARKGGVLVVVSVRPGSDAEAKGITPGDRVRRIGDQSTRELNLFEAESMLSGAPGGSVAVSLLRRTDPHTMDVELLFAPTPPQPVTLETVDAKAGVAVLRIPHFSGGVADRVAAALVQAGSKGTRSLLLDLRGNAWGTMDEAAHAAGLFVGDTVVARLKDRQGGGSDLRSGRAKQPFTGMVALLVDSGTAESAEMFAAALHDLREATIMGETSFGVGAEQELLPLKNGAWLKLSVRKYVSPEGAAWHGKGIEPAAPIVVAQENLTPADRLKAQLDLAVEHLKTLGRSAGAAAPGREGGV